MSQFASLLSNIAPGESGGVPTGGVAGGDGKLGKFTRGKILNIAGSVLKGIGQQQPFDAQAGQADANAVAAQQKAAAEAVRFGRGSRRRLGAIRARAGASGTQISGSVADVLTDQALEEEEARLLILFQGETEARRSRAQASLLRRRGQSSLLGGATEAFTKALPTLLE